ncbi:MAG: methylated-DNA--[protein]-cysteine S-methyltransferase [Rhodospirillaceae bacterium]
MNRISSNTNFNNDARDYQRVEQAIAYIIEHRVSQPELEDVAANIGLSPFHTQRLFSRWAGVSPKRFLSYLTVEHAKQKLEESVSVLDAALDIGLSGPSRLYDLMVSVEAMTPGEYKTQGSDIVISYGQALTPFGAALLLVSDRGLCGLEFFTDDFAVLLDTAKARWPLSYFEEDQSLAKEMASRIFSADDTVPILMKGTSWQLQVWSALLRVPPGVITSYGQIAENLCTKKASRAVGTAVAANHIGYVVPCHRVLRTTGMFKRYRWGAPRRWAMLAKESAEH